MTKAKASLAHCSCGRPMRSGKRFCAACWTSGAADRAQRQSRCRTCGATLPAKRRSYCSVACAEVADCRRTMNLRERAPGVKRQEDLRPLFGWVSSPGGLVLTSFHAGSAEELASALATAPRPDNCTLWLLSPLPWPLLCSPASPVVLAPWLWECAAGAGDLPALTRADPDRLHHRYCRR